MAATELATRPQEPTTKRRPFSAWVKRFTSLNRGQHGANKKAATGIASAKSKKNANTNGNLKNGNLKNNPYPQSGYVRQSPHSSADGFVTPASRPQNDDGSIISGPPQEQEAFKSNRSTAPTVATNHDTVHSDAGHSKAFTSTTGGGALSSVDGAGNNSTFSSPNHSDHSLATTLTTIQSTSQSNALQQTGTSGTLSHHQHNNNHSSAHHSQNQNPVMFSHQYPVSPSPSALGTASAIPRHLSEAHARDNPANASNLLTDDASIVTLASSSKRRRRSMDTDASVRALAPNSVWGGSRESLPLSVLSADPTGPTNAGGLYSASQSRPSIGGLASAERASVYSSSGIAAPALASERNSYYANPTTQARKDLSDAKSLRSLNNLDARSTYDSKSINDGARSTDARSLRGYEGSMRSGALGHGREGSLSGSLAGDRGVGSPLASPGLRHMGSGVGMGLGRRSEEWVEEEADEDGEDSAAVRDRQGSRDEGKMV